VILPPCEFVKSEQNWPLSLVDQVPEIFVNQVPLRHASPFTEPFAEYVFLNVVSGLSPPWVPETVDPEYSRCTSSFVSRFPPRSSMSPTVDGCCAYVMDGWQPSAPITVTAVTKRIMVSSSPGFSLNDSPHGQIKPGEVTPARAVCAVWCGGAVLRVHRGTRNRYSRSAVMRDKVTHVGH